MDQGHNLNQDYDEPVEPPTADDIIVETMALVAEVALVWRGLGELGDEKDISF